MENNQLEHNNTITTFSRKNVEERSPIVKISDSDEQYGLDLFCYTSCDNDCDDFLKNCRGLVFHGDELVLKAFPYASEYATTEPNELEEKLANFSKWTFFDAYEGALLRMFYFDNRWFLSTHRKLNAFRSKWASKESFGTLFTKALELEETNNTEFASRLTGDGSILDRFQNSLDTTKQYMFILKNNEDNRIVCKPPTNTFILHVGTFTDGELSLDVDTGIERPEKHSFLNLDYVIDYVNNINVFDIQGVVGFGPNGEQIKIVHPHYRHLFRLRGNEPSVKFRYLQLIADGDKVDSLYELYPEKKNVFNEYNSWLTQISNYIYTSYVDRFIRKNFVSVPREEYRVIRECHDWYLSNRDSHRISIDKVEEILSKQPPTNLNRMIRRHRLEKLNKENTKRLL